MREKTTNKISQLSLLIALTMILGYYLKVPTPTGILPLLDVGVFLTAFLYGSKEGALVGGLSAFLLDLLSGYPQWMFFSLFFHGLQGYFAGFKGKSRLVGLCLASLVMVAGYALAGSLLHGWGAALAEVLPNFLQNLLGILLALGLKKILVRQVGWTS
ncbi:ECF transporter S component [Streptococcus oricebi]|uniref:ECF transporter S component n=1 Tax=Streptococcus oricebi TaxID=1547447 RepID=A0ABS5B5G6_9STRE|nr:ECF transporter S component [Streptococcus oricebi]MBP2624045.1 ECF transporter S component [Streptococcus oricebi]